MAATQARQNDRGRQKKFRSMLTLISQSLTEEEWENLLFLRELPGKVEEECKKSRSKFWKYMINQSDEEDGYHIDNPNELFEDLKEIGQQALSTKAEQMYADFCVIKPTNATGNVQQALSQTNEGGHQGLTYSPPVPQQSRNMNPGYGTQCPSQPLVQPSQIVQLPQSFPQSPPHLQQLPGTHPTAGASNPAQRASPVQHPSPQHDVALPFNSPVGHAHGLQANTSFTKPIPTVSTAVQGGRTSQLTEIQLLQSSSTSTVSVPLPLQSSSRSNSAPACDVSTTQLASQTQSALPLQPESAQQNVALSRNNPLGGVHGHQLPSAPGQLTSQEPRRQLTATEASHHPPHDLGTGYAVQPASAQSEGISAAGQTSLGLKSTEPIPTMSTGFQGGGGGHTSHSTGSQLAQPNFTSCISGPMPLKSSENTNSAAACDVSTTQLASQTQSALPVQPESAQQNVTLSLNNLVGEVHGHQAHASSMVSATGQLTSQEPRRQVTATEASHHSPHDLGTGYAVQPASAQSQGISAAGQASPGLKSSEPIPTMSTGFQGGGDGGHTSHSTGTQLPQSNFTSCISGPMPLKGSESTNSGITPDVSTKQLAARTGRNITPTLENPIQPSSTPTDLRDQLEKLGLTHVEGLLNDPDSARFIPALGQDDIQKDSGPQEDSQPCEVVGDPINLEVMKDSVKDSATPLKRDVVMDSAHLEEEESLNFNMKTTPKEPVKLRAYQHELAEAGEKGYSYIICAPTGSGKTITAAHICFQRMKKMKNEESFKGIFIVPTRHLKKQQREAFNDLFQPGQVTSLGEGQLFSEVYSKGNIRILMITAQVLVNAIAQNQFKMSDASMLIFDECHHTTLKHPYNEIMRQYLKEKRSVLAAANEERWPVGRCYGGLPQVIGLTASIGTGSSDDAHGHLVVLCANLDSLGVKVVSKPENYAELKDINRPPEEDEIITTPKKHPTPTSSRIVEILESVMSDIQQDVLQNLLKDLDVPFSPPMFGTLDYESWIATIRSKAEIRLPELHICSQYLFRLNLALLIYNDLRAEDAINSIEIFKGQTAGKEDLLTAGRHCRLLYEKDLQELKDLAKRDNPLSNPKLRNLIQLIKKEYKEKPKSKGIVLVRTRFATMALQDFVQDNPELEGLSPRIKVVRIVGQNKEIEDGQTVAKQEAALFKFKHGDANLLVATDIIQEGLDVPACNIIIRYNFVSNEIGTVQSKGRARAENSKCYLIVESGSQNEAREIRNRERVKEMAKAIEVASQMDRDVWTREVYLRQLSIVEEMEKKEAELRAKQASGCAADWKLLCGQCRSFICKASDLERRLSNYTCLDETIRERTHIQRRVVQEYRESRTVGIVKCGKCGSQLGQAVEYKRHSIWKPGYNLTPKSFIFSFRDGQEEKRFAKWKKSASDFQIATEP